MSSPEAPTPVETTRRTPRETPCSPIYGAEACLPLETLLDSPQVQTSDRFMQKWPQPKTRAPSSNADGDPGSGPSLTVNTKPRRAPQLSPSWEGPFKVTVMHRPEGNRLATTEEVPPPRCRSISVSSIGASLRGQICFLFCN
jgi:hypothetical protein